MIMDKIPLPPEHEECCYQGCTMKPKWHKATYLKRFFVTLDLCHQHYDLLYRIQEIDRIMGDEL